jgi:hypothetical protein
LLLLQNYNWSPTSLVGLLEKVDTLFKIVFHFFVACDRYSIVLISVQTRLEETLVLKGRCEKRDGRLF